MVVNEASEVPVEGIAVDLVVVSNRVTRGNNNGPITGGLAAALLPVVENSGAIWVGSSGRVREGTQKEPFAEIESLGSGALAMLDLPAAHYGGYYEGFANSALWPALHSRADLIRASQADYLSYREVNAFMARALLRFRKPDTAFCSKSLLPGVSKPTANLRPNSTANIPTP